MISVVFSDPNICLRIPASAADAAAISPKGINALLANGVITFFIYGNPVFNKGPDCIIFDSWVFENLISTDELLKKCLRNTRNLSVC